MMKNVLRESLCLYGIQTLSLVYWAFFFFLLLFRLFCLKEKKQMNFTQGISLRKMCCAHERVCSQICAHVIHFSKAQISKWHVSLIYAQAHKLFSGFSIACSIKPDG